MNKTLVHPEVLPIVKAEFDRLHSKHPNVDGTKLWKIALEYAYDVCTADTFLLKDLIERGSF